MLRVERISEARFAGMAAEWNSCLAASDANPLFMSWPWLFSWWQTWSQVLGMDLVLLGVFDENGELVGIGPFSRRVLVAPGGVRVTRLYILGNAWRLAPTVRTEYCGIIARRRYEQAVGEVVLAALEQLGWDELICTDVPLDQFGQFKRAGLDELRGYRIIQRTFDVGICVNTTGRFTDWLSTLGKNTRLKAYNRRTYLEQQGVLAFSAHDTERDGDFFELLNDFHQWRWGKPAFEREALKFHRLLSQRLPLCDGKPTLSVVRYNGRCVSVLYDIVVRDCRFNLQAGYDEAFDAKVSLGYLHLGFAIEEAFIDKRTCTYDLLAGAGKKQYYKSHFQGETVHFSTFQVVRGPLLKLLYAIQSVSPPLMAKAFNRRIGL